MGIAAVCIGLFILFAVAFNGGLGPAIYTYSGCLSALTVIFAGLASFKARWRHATPWLLGTAGLVYVPIIYQRFMWTWGPDWGGIVFDALYMIFISRFLCSHRSGAARQSNIRDA
jgi:hypothetical protein